MDALKLFRDGSIGPFLKKNKWKINGLILKPNIETDRSGGDPLN